MKKNSEINVLKAKKNAAVLLSGGLDSFISLAYCVSCGINVPLALTFDYGQRAAADEISSAKEIAKIYGAALEIVKLPFLSKISTSALNTDENLEFETLNQKSADAVWVPNRNGLFLNIAASYCEAMNLDYIIFGANKEEAQTFPDNTNEFIEKINEEFSYSTKTKVKVLAPLSNLEKHEIINKGIELNVNFKLLKSCYNKTENVPNEGTKTHCGKCESCKRLKNAILKSDNKDLIKLLF